HVEQALQCIDFNDVQPKLVTPDGELLVRNPLFEIQKWSLDSPRQVSPPEQFAIVCCLTGSVGCAEVELRPGGFLLVPAAANDRELKPLKTGTTLLRVTIPV